MNLREAFTGSFPDRFGFLCKLSDTGQFSGISLLFSSAL